IWGRPKGGTAPAGFPPLPGLPARLRRSTGRRAPGRELAPAPGIHAPPARTATTGGATRVRRTRQGTAPARAGRRGAPRGDLAPPPGTHAPPARTATPGAATRVRRTRQWTAPARAGRRGRRRAA